MDEVGGDEGVKYGALGKGRSKAWSVAWSQAWNKVWRVLKGTCILMCSVETSANYSRLLQAVVGDNANLI